MNIQLICTQNDSKAQGLPLVGQMAHGGQVFLNKDTADITFTLDAKRTVYIFGEVFYWKSGLKALSRNPNAVVLKRLFGTHDLKDIVQNLEGQFIGVEVDLQKGQVRIFGDRYAREDVFYATHEGSFFLSGSLGHIFEQVPVVYDQKMLAHMFAVYGWYTPKGYTMYQGVFKPKAGEILVWGNKGLALVQVPFTPVPIEPFTDKELPTYYDLLRESIAMRSNTKDGKIWVSSSSGWDSSVILGILVDMYGPKRIGMMTGSVEYSKSTGVINRFEMDKTLNIGKFYGIKPLSVSLDFKNTKTVGYWKSIAPALKSKQMYSLTGLNLSRISDGVAHHDAAHKIVFNGETSDSFHNFGFSQFATFFHTVKSFTEYGDKMNCYLYGPTFLQKVLNGSYTKDKVYQIFMKMFDGVQFADQWPDKKSMLESYLLPLFYGGPRIPFASTIRNPLLTSKAAAQVTAFPFREMMPQVLSTLNEKNIYSWIIYMYLSMHSQGSTVNIHKHAMKLNDHRWRSPYNDHRLIELLSEAPESWGRGLDLNHTKHPLKWVAKNKIKFPYELLEQGPHSYLYDVIEGFSLLAEIVYRSGFTAYFKDELRKKAYRGLLDPSHFELDYIDRLVTDYISGKEVKGRDFNNLFSIITLTATGWY